MDSIGSAIGHDQLPGQIKVKVSEMTGFQPDQIRVLASSKSNQEEKFAIVFKGACLNQDHRETVDNFAKVFNLPTRPGNASPDSMVVDGVCRQIASQILSH